MPVIEITVAAALGGAALVVGVVGGALAGRRGAAGEADSDASASLDHPARILDVPPEAEAVADAADELVSAVEMTIGETDEIERPETGDTSPVAQAKLLRQAIQSGAFAPVNDSVEPTETRQETSTQLNEAVELVRTQTTPRTTNGQRLLTYLQDPHRADREQFAEAVQSIVESLNRLDSLDEALGDVTPHVERQQLAKDLETRAKSVPGDTGDALRAIADELRTVTRDLEDCQSVRSSLSDHADRICRAANEQSTVSFGDRTNTTDQLATVRQAVDSGEIRFEDEATSVANVTRRLRASVSPESKLANELLDELMRDRSADRHDFETTLTDVVEAIDQAETVRHRLDGIDVTAVEERAGRLVEELAAVDASVAPLVRERARNLQEAVTQAGSTDLVTVYAARQELRFYDRQLLSELRDSSSDRDPSPNVEAELTAVEQRRSAMREEYPTKYPEHDHSIPIHFLELVAALHEDAQEAHRSGQPERALGYLEAADQTLSWVTELYERQAYSVLLEQLRG